jgi:hypothetical protein
MQQPLGAAGPAHTSRATPSSATARRDVEIPVYAGSELQVQSVLTGRVTPVGDMLDIQSELVECGERRTTVGKGDTVGPCPRSLTLQDEIRQGDLRYAPAGVERGRRTAGLPGDSPENTGGLSSVPSRPYYYFDQRTADGIKAKHRIVFRRQSRRESRLRPRVCWLGECLRLPATRSCRLPGMSRSRSRRQ